MLVAGAADVEGGAACGGRGVRVESVTFGCHVASQLHMLTLREEVAQAEVFQVGNEIIVFAVEVQRAVHVYSHVADVAVGFGIHAAAVVTGIASKGEAARKIQIFQFVCIDETLHKVGVVDFCVKCAGQCQVVAVQTAGVEAAFHVHHAVHPGFQVFHLEVLEVAGGVGFQSQVL